MSPSRTAAAPGFYRASGLVLRSTAAVDGAALQIGNGSKPN